MLRLSYDDGIEHGTEEIIQLEQCVCISSKYAAGDNFIERERIRDFSLDDYDSLRVPKVKF